VDNEPFSYPTHIRFGRRAAQLSGVLLPLFGHRVARIRTPSQLERIGYFDKLLIAAMVSHYKDTGRLHEINWLNQLYWASDSATQFHGAVQERFQSIFLAKHAPLVDELERILAASAIRYHTLYEIGCGSGQVVDYLAGRLRMVERFVGIDLSAAQINRNRARFVRPQLRFEAGDASEWIAAHAEPRSIFVTNDGVFEYFTPQALSGLLASFATRLQPSLLAIVEPLAAHHDLSVDGGSIVYGAENTYSHDYPRICERAGLKILFRSEVTAAQQRYLLLIAASPTSGTAA